ncbi:YigZ family protein [Philodulcilactobacillus myokoensis]|uniref:YigZ family protein n=1 Tax=Philodulcilactobacillus myokoensis TaxID=2929573 RepID=A0A9W6B1D0_9LACO|nr:YigZ family protein [Philodulcilactobacillus myokoensis]GLB47147.1 YigZ family protein [Philodulcilactobacillus myokoensis]
MTKNYLTIKTNGQHEIDIKKSRFICYVKRIKDEDDAKKFIEKIKTINRKATHNCFAYMVGRDDHIQRESDNGEPSSTAGIPILRVLQMKHLHDTVAVVTRYFGGIKLGAGGLIRAYSNATSKTIDQIGIVKRVLQTQISINVDYSLGEKLKYHLEQERVNILNIKYTSKMTIIVAIDTPQIKPFQEKIINLLNDRVEFKIGQKQYLEVDYHPNQK